jgi:hypothetical protein
MKRREVVCGAAASVAAVALPGAVFQVIHGGTRVYGPVLDMHGIIRDHTKHRPSLGVEREDVRCALEVCFDARASIIASLKARASGVLA